LPAKPQRRINGSRPRRQSRRRTQSRSPPWLDLWATVRASEKILIDGKRRGELIHATHDYEFRRGRIGPLFAHQDDYYSRRQRDYGREYLLAIAKLWAEADDLLPTGLNRKSRIIPETLEPKLDVDAGLLHPIFGIAV
jgi:hypothetical protein